MRLDRGVHLGCINFAFSKCDQDEITTSRKGPDGHGNGRKAGSTPDPRIRLCNGKNAASPGEERSAPDRIRTCDLRFRRKGVDPPTFGVIKPNRPSDKLRCSTYVALILALL
jgi:hypothetical protein